MTFGVRLATAAAATAMLLTSPGCRFDDIPPDNISLPGESVEDPEKAPFNIHLTWQGDPGTTMTVQWSTLHNDPGSYTPYVWFAEDTPDNVDTSGEFPELLVFEAENVVDGTHVVYHETITGEGDDLIHWEVELTGLEPRTRYYYRVGSWDEAQDGVGPTAGINLSTVYHFTTGLSKGDDAAFTFLSSGDSRSGYDEIMTQIDRLAAIEMDFWLFNGDMNEFGTQEEWDAWFHSMAPLLPYRPVMTVQGNHEVVADTYYGQFALPVEPDLPEGYEEYAYSFDYGNVHFTALNSLSEDIVANQNAWLEADLAAASQDPDIDWIIALFHHPAYSASNHGSTDRVIQNWLPLMEQYGVDMTFSGHDHNYERTHPVRGGQVVAPGEGPVHVVVGAFFSPGYSAGQDWFTVTSSHGDNRCYATLEVNGSELNLTAYSGDGTQVLDEFTLTK